MLKDMIRNKTIHLEGLWSYELDREDIGLKEMWQHRELAFAGFQLPGTTATNGIGDALDMKPELNKEAVRCLRQRFRYVGAAWYQKKIRIPDEWRGKTITLFLERVMFQSMLWVDGDMVGMRDSLSTAHRYDVTDFVKARHEHMLTIRVDNRDVQNIGPFPSAYTDETQTIWNGIVGKIQLSASDRISIGCIQVYPDIKNQSIRAKVHIKNACKADALASVAINAYEEKSGRKCASTIKKQDLALSPGYNVFEFIYPMDGGFHVWDEFTPVLYSLQVELEADCRSDKFKNVSVANFGMREICVEDAQFKLNENRIFLRGTLDCCIYPLTGYPPTDRESWWNIFTVVKDYGLNHVRFHSWCPPEAAFEAADETGVYLGVEGPIWMDFWTGYTIGAYPEHYSYIPAEAKRICDVYGNHPSFILFSNGNELNGDFRLLHNTIDLLKKCDPRRLYTMTTNFDRPYDDAEDYFAAQAADGVAVRGQFYLDKMVEGTELDYSKAVPMRKVPIVSHEIGQYSVYPDIDEIPLYSGALRPLNFEAIKNDLEQKCMLRYARSFMMGSGKLAAQLYKDEIEAALRTDSFGGFQLLDLHDFPGQSTATVGLLNSFWQSKGIISSGEFRRFCSQVVPLLIMQKRVFGINDEFGGIIKISNFSAADIIKADVFWQISYENGDIYKAGELTLVDIPKGGLATIGEISAFNLCGVNSPAGLTVTIGIRNSDVQNTWRIWVYPENARAGIGELTPNGVEIADMPDDRLFRKLSEGAKVLLLPERLAVRQTTDGKFFPVFWSPVHFTSTDPCGMFCDGKHPVFKSFPTDGYAGYQWKDLLENSFNMCMDDLPDDFEPIVHIIPNFFNNRRATNLFEARVGKGRLMVCSIDLINDIKKRLPAGQFLRSMLEYMDSEDFMPDQELSIECLNKFFTCQQSEG